MTEAEFLTAVAEYLVHGHHEQGLSQQVNNRCPPGSLERLTIYRNAYYVRLQNALAKDFPALLSAMGDARFGKIMTAYLSDYPSVSPSLRQLGRNLNSWLMNSDYPTVWAELAALEWAVLNSFDAANASLLSSDQLARIPADQWESLKLHLHPSVTLIFTIHNVREIWEAVIKANKKPPVTEINDYLVVWRLDDGPKVKPITLASYKLLLLWSRNKSFGDACKSLERLGIVDNIPHVAAECLFFAAQFGWLRDFDR